MTQHDFDHWDPKGQPSGGGDKPPEPDASRIVRRVRLYFLISAMLAVAMVAVGLRPLVDSGPAIPSSLPSVAGMAVVLLALLALAWRNLRPDRLILAGKRALDAEDPRERAPKAERARRMGLSGLAMSWCAQAISLAMLPVFTGLLLQVLNRQTWPLFAFAAMGIAAGSAYHTRVAAAVRQAVEDQELRNAYGTGNAG